MRCPPGCLRRSPPATTWSPSTRGAWAPARGCPVVGPSWKWRQRAIPSATRSRSGRALGVQCLAEAAALVDTMTSTDIARDLDLVRAALGDERLSYVGFSWGTLLGA